MRQRVGMWIWKASAADLSSFFPHETHLAARQISQTEQSSAGFLSDLKRITVKSAVGKMITGIYEKKMMGRRGHVSPRNQIAIHRMLA